MREPRVIGHDLRNGINTLVLNARCLEICDVGEAIECIDAILTAADSIVVLIDEAALLPDSPA